MGKKITKQIDFSPDKKHKFGFHTNYFWQRIGFSLIVPFLRSKNSVNTFSSTKHHKNIHKGSGVSGNSCFRLFPRKKAKLWEWIFSFPSCSRILGMFFHSLLFPNLPFHIRESKREMETLDFQYFQLPLYFLQQFMLRR